MLRKIASIPRARNRNLDMVKPGSIPADVLPDDEKLYPVATSRTMFIDSVDRGVADTIVEHLGSDGCADARRGSSAFLVARWRASRGATAFAHRRSRSWSTALRSYERPDQTAKYAPWVTGFAAALKQSDKGAYVNFVNDEGAARVRDAYPGRTWDRLTQIKRRYDPTNLFHLNQNIPPGS